MRIKALLLFSLLLLGEILQAQYKDSLITKRRIYLSDNPKQSKLDLFVDSLTRSYMQSPQNYGLSIGILNNQESHYYNYGETKRSSKIIPSQHSIYEIGSITKTFCGILLAYAVCENKIKLNDDIRLYLKGDYPNLVYNQKPIRIVQLANHTSGLALALEDLKFQPNFDSLNPYKNYSKTMMLKHLGTIKLEQEPGQNFQYSNLGTSLLSLILETIYNKTFEELVQEKITQPLQLKSTGINLNAEQQLQITGHYNSDGLEMPAANFNNFASTAGLLSSTNDMISFLKYNLMEEDTLTKLSHQITFNSRESVGLFWFIKKTKQGNTLFWQNGNTFGASSFCGFINENKCAVIVLSNSATVTDYIGIKLLNFLQL